MIFVTADSCRAQLERLTQMLVSAFPGSTIYRHADVCHVPHDVLHHKVDAVLLEAKSDGPDFLSMLRRQKPNVPVFLLAKTEAIREEAERAGANGCFVLPEGEQQLLDAIRLAKSADVVLR